jgi:hypothetical protein
MNDDDDDDDDNNNNNNIGTVRACNTQGRDKKCIENFGLKTEVGLCLGQKIILKWVLKR